MGAASQAERADAPPSAATTLSSSGSVPEEPPAEISSELREEEEVMDSAEGVLSGGAPADARTVSTALPASGKAQHLDQQGCEQQQGPGPGVRFYTDGAPGRRMPLWQEAAAAATLLVFIAWIYVIAALMLAAPFSPGAALAVLCAWGTLLLPCGPVLWRPVLTSPVFALWRRYFNYSVCYEQKLDASQHFLYADFPHGAFPLSQLLGLTVRHKAGWDGENFYGLAADSAFRIPLWRHVYSWLGIVPASVANLKKHIKWGCVACTPGGIAEMYLAGGRADHIYIRSRKGFVSVAVEEGIDIVPVYHFGNTQILSFGPKFLEPYGRRWRFSLGLLYGVLTLPIPRRVDLMMCVGSPVRVEKVARSDPRFQEVVDETHARYMETLRQLFDKHKAEYGWPNRKLIMH